MKRPSIYWFPLTLVLCCSYYCELSEAVIGTPTSSKNEFFRLKSEIQTTANNNVLDNTSSTTRCHKTTSCYRKKQQQQQQQQQQDLHKDTTTKIRGGSSTSAVANTLPIAIFGTVIMAGIEKMTKEVLLKTGIKFPPALAGCIVLFIFLLGTEFISPSTANAIFQSLTPGAALLAKYLPVLFVPGLVMLPLAPSIGGTADLIKFIVTVIVGFLFSFTTSMYGVITVQKFSSKQTVPDNKKIQQTIPTTPAPAMKPFSDITWNFVLLGTLLSGGLHMCFEDSTILQTMFFTFFTFMAYVGSARLPSSFNQVIHPLVTSSVTILLFFRFLSKFNDVPFLDILRSYKTGKLLPLQKTGAGDLLLYALGPCVVSFAIAAFSRKNLIAQNFVVILTAAIIASVGGLFGTAFFVSGMNLGGKTNGKLIRLSVVARSVTTPLAIALTNMIGGDISIAAAIVCLTGIFGASYGRKLLDLCNVTDPLVRGLTMGSSAQGLGVASLASEPDALPFAAVAMVFGGLAATTLASIAPIQKALIKAATG